MCRYCRSKRHSNLRFCVQPVRLQNCLNWCGIVSDLEDNVAFVAIVALSGAVVETCSLQILLAMKTDKLIL